MGLPVDGGEDVIGGVTALNQRRGRNDEEEGRVAQQSIVTMSRHCSRRQRFQGLQRKAGERANHCDRNDDPDQAARIDALDQIAASERTQDEGG